MRPGILFIVVGPSGAGKDTLMDGARKALADSGRFAFARRLITRPADAGGEDHEAIGEVEFAALQAAGGLLASWNAHGLHYGLRASLRDELLRGRHIVANGSRGVLKALAGAVPRLIIMNVTASPEVLARRLASRGRETPEDIAARLARRTPDLPDGIETLVVENNGAVEEGVEHFLAAIDAATRRLTLKLHDEKIPEWKLLRSPSPDFQLLLPGTNTVSRRLNDRERQICFHAFLSNDQAQRPRRAA